MWRMIDRWKADRAILAREDTPSDAEIQEAEKWAAEGPKSLKDLTPGAGGAGLNWGDGEDAADKVAFRQDVQTEVEPFWSNQHEFFMRKKGWSWLGATVTVDLQVENLSKMGNAHLTMKPIKVPDTVSLGANVEPGQRTTRATRS